MRTANVDFNAKDSTGRLRVRESALIGAYRGESVNVVDRDGELVAVAVVDEVGSGFARLRVIPNTVRDLPATPDFAMLPVDRVSATTHLVRSASSVATRQVALRLLAR